MDDPLTHTLLKRPQSTTEEGVCGQATDLVLDQGDEPLSRTVKDNVIRRQSILFSQIPVLIKDVVPWLKLAKELPHVVLEATTHSPRDRCVRPAVPLSRHLHDIEHQAKTQFVCQDCPRGQDVVVCPQMNGWVLLPERVCPLIQPVHLAKVIGDDAAHLSCAASDPLEIGTKRRLEVTAFR